jgi:hypothetical protein
LTCLYLEIYPEINYEKVSSNRISINQINMSSESSSGSGSSGQPEDEKDTEEATIAKKEEKEIDSVTDYHVEKESEKLQGALLSLVGSSQTGSAK